SAAPPNAAGLIPTEANAEADIANLPVRKLIATFSAALQSALAEPMPDGIEGENTDRLTRQRTREALMTAQMLMPGILREAGTTLMVKNTYTKSAELDTRLEADIKAAAGTPYGATGTITASLRGLQELLAKIQ